MMNDTTRLQCDAPALSADASFGPIAKACRPDFTFTFEQYFFSIVPSAIFLFLAPIRVNTLRKRQIKVGGKLLRSVKLGAIGVFAVLQLTIVLLWATTNLHSIRTPAAVASSFSFVSSLALFALSHLEHSRSLRPSALLNAYLLLTVLFDIVVLRTLWIAFPSVAVRDLFTASFALKAVILLLEAKEKRKYVRTDSLPGPEETSGLYSQSFMWWLNSIIKQGYRRILKPMDLFPMDESMSSEILNERFWKEWNAASRNKSPSLTKVVVKLLRWPLVIPILPRLALLGFTFCQPLLVQRLLQFLSNRNESLNTGYGLLGAYAIVYFGISVSSSLFLHRNYRFLTMLRGILVSAVYVKTTEISITAIDNNAAVTLMSTDVERLILGLRGMHDLWANILQLILATWLLGLRLGWACIGPIVVVLVTAGITVGLAFISNRYQMDWIRQIEKRVGITSNMLGHMKGIKMLGLTSRLTQLIQSLRSNELNYAEKYWLLQAVTAGIAFAPQTMGPVATFAFYAIVAAKDGTTLDATRLFPSLALLILLTQPLPTFFSDLIEFRVVFGCAGRLETFLVSQTRSDHRLNASESTRRLLTSTQPSRDFETWQADQNDIELAPMARLNLSSDIVRIEDGSFGWTRNAPAILQDIDCAVRQGALTLLIGPVGSGKSTLLKAILGETPNLKGFVYVSQAETAYCDQTPWLINASVKNNIIAFSNFDQNLYDTVIHSCDLEQDIRTFPNGHDTIVGSKGISLSTGQKQRIAIARAVYAKKSFVILDDVVSGLDVNTQKNVVSRLLGPNGLLRKWRTTVLIATHAVNLLPLSDHIIALSSNGTIVEQGTFQDLNATDGYVRKFCLENATNTKTIGEKPRTDPDPIVKSLPQAQTSPNIPSEDDKGRQLGDWAVYKYYFRAIGMDATTIFLFLAGGWAFFYTFPTVWLKWYADANATEPNKHTRYYLGVYAAFQALMLIDISFLAWISFKVMAKRSGLRLHETLLRTVMAAPMAFISKTDIGSITTRFSQDMQLLDTTLPMSAMIVAGGFLGCFAQMGLIASGAYYVAICFPFLFVIYFFLQRYYLRTSRQMRFLDLEEKAPVYTQFLESLSGLATLRAFSWQKSSIAHNHVLVDRSQKPFYLMYMIQIWVALVLDLITTALAILVVGISVRMRDTVSVGFTGVSLTQIISFTNYLRVAILFWTQMETSIGAVARVKKFEEETENENQSTESFEPPPDWPTKGGIDIENLTVSYGTDENSRKALDNISVSIAPGQKLAIVGRTGSGKSTLLSTLFRLLPISSGRILIDGLDISTIPRHHIRLRLNAISEDPFFLDPGTIRQNLDPYSSDHTDTHLIATLEKVGLWRIVERKGGLDTAWTEDLFSHGQKQIFCLARALLRSGSIVVMDEVTSAVDRETDRLMQRVIREEFRGRTVVSIVHRVETVKDYDTVVVLGEGSVVEVGRPDDLMRRVGGVFRGMVERGQ